MIEISVLCQPKSGVILASCGIGSMEIMMCLLRTRCLKILIIDHLDERAVIANSEFAVLIQIIKSL